MAEDGRGRAASEEVRENARARAEMIAMDRWVSMFPRLAMVDAADELNVDGSREATALCQLGRMYVVSAASEKFTVE